MRVLLKNRTASALSVFPLATCNSGHAQVRSYG